MNVALPRTIRSRLQGPASRWPARRSRAFTLVEVVLAIGLVAFVIVALMGVLPIGLISVRDAERETLAASLMNSIVADLKFSPRAGATLVMKLNPHPLLDQGATDNIYYFSENQQQTSLNEAMCKVLVRTETAVANRGRGVLLRITWPAQAADGREIGAVETYTFFPSYP